MEIYLIPIMLLMLVMLIGIAIVVCYLAYKRADRAIKRTEALYDGQEYLARKLGELEERQARKPAQEPTEADKRAARVDKQVEDMMRWMPDDVGLRLGGVRSESIGGDLSES